MNLLSAISIIICTSFFIGASRMLTVERKSILNGSAAATLYSLSCWSFCNAFFFAASNEIDAMFWHKLSSIGWCSFVALTAYYFLALTNRNKKMMAPWKQLLFFTPTIILIIYNLFSSTTSLATGIVPSLGGFGWTYTNSLTNAWLWIYLVYVMLYFGVSFYFLYSWAKSVKHKLKKEMAFLFIVLDVVTILCGVVTDIILPIFNPTIPAIASIATAIFGIGYFSLIYRHDLFNINLIISSDDILQISNNALFVMDENKEILRCSAAVTTLTGFNKGELIGSNFNNLMPEYIDINELINGKDILNAEARLSCKDNTFKDVLLSASTAKDKRNSFLCIIVSCQDITKQKVVQLELEIEREKYKQLATDYQLLAYYDPLTTLANRRHFFSKLNDYASQYHSQNEDFSVIFLDLDNFKFVNDVYGHEGGDELLMATAVKLRACISDDEFVARIGGDEFVILFHCQNVTDVETKMQLIRTEFNKDIYFNDRPYKIAISAGYDIFSQVEDMSELMQNADKAMYKNKNKLINGKIIR